MVAIRLFETCKIGDIRTLKNLDSVKQTLVDEDGASCLHYAARGGSLAVVEYLVNDLHFSVGQRTKTGATALHDAAAKGNTAVVKWLVENGGINANDQDGAGITALHLAAQYRHFLTIEWLLDEAEGDVSKRSGSGALPLHFAAVGGDMNCVNILVDENPRLINMQMNNGTTAVYLACQAGHLDVVKYLVSRNGATKIKAYDAMACLHAAAQMGHLNIVKWLVTEEKCNPNDRDFDGATPLHFAASRGHAKVVEWLMREGKARVALDNLGGSPLHNAAELGEVESIKALLDCGCDVTLTDNDGLTAAELADNCDQSECAALIRGEITFDQIRAGKSDPEEATYNHHLHSPRLNFPPPPPFPPEDLEVSHIVDTHTTATNTSFSHLSPSPPLPPPPALPLSSPGSDPSTVGSPISPPTPIHEEARETISSLGAGFSAGKGGSSRAYSATSEEPLIRRAESQISVDSSASNFGVFEQQDAGVVHTVTAEIHKTPQSVPPTPRPYGVPAVPGHGSLNTTLESIVFSGSASPRSQDESSFNLDRRYVAHRSPALLKIGVPIVPLETSAKSGSSYHYGRQGLVLSELSGQQSPSQNRGTPQLLTNVVSSQGHSSTSTTIQISGTPDTQNSSQRSVSFKQQENKESAEEGKPRKKQYYETPYRGDFNTVTKSSFARARALFEKSLSGAQICPDNGELCTTAEKEIYSSKGKPQRPKMEPEQAATSEIESSKHVSNGTATSSPADSPRSSGADNPAKSVVSISKGNVTVISTGGKSTATGKSNTPPAPFSKRASAPVIAPLRASGGPMAMMAQKDSVLQELQTRNRKSAPIDTDASTSSSEPLVNGHSKAEASDSNHSSDVVMRSSQVNGTRNGDDDRGSNRDSQSRLSSSSTGSQPYSPVHSKNDLIAEMQSAISGTSNLSLRRAKSKGEGVSMVYMSKKGGGVTEAKPEHKPLSGEFDPKNFLDQVEKVDSTGRAIPEWRRHVLAKHMAEKAQKEFEEQKAIDDYESRFKNMPAWKRAIIEKREAHAKE